MTRMSAPCIASLNRAQPGLFPLSRQWTGVWRPKGPLIHSTQVLRRSIWLNLMCRGQDLGRAQH